MLTDLLIFPSLFCSIPPFLLHLVISPSLPLPPRSLSLSLSPLICSSTLSSTDFGTRLLAVASVNRPLKAVDGQYLKCMPVLLRCPLHPFASFAALSLDFLYLPLGAPLGRSIRSSFTALGEKPFICCSAS